MKILLYFFETWWLDEYRWDNSYRDCGGKSKESFQVIVLMLKVAGSSRLYFSYLTNVYNVFAGLSVVSLEPLFTWKTLTETSGRRWYFPHTYWFYVVKIFIKHCLLVVDCIMLSYKRIQCICRSRLVIARAIFQLKDMGQRHKKDIHNDMYPTFLQWYNL